MKRPTEESLPIVPWIETLRGAVNFVKNPIPVIDEAIQKYGKTYLTRIIGGQRLIISADPDVVQHVLQGNHKNYEKSKIQTDTLGQYVGQGLLTANGAYWLKQRRLIQPGFHKARIEALIPIVEVEVQSFCDELTLKIKNNSTVDLGEAMMELTLRIVSKALFSTGIDQSTIELLGENFTKLQEHIIREVRQPQWNWLRRLNGKQSRAMKLAEGIRDIMIHIIRERQQSTRHIDDLLGMLLDARYEDTGLGMSDKQLIDEAIILFIAGHETTANALTWCIYLLSKHSDWVDKLQDNVKVSPASWTMSDIMRPDYLTYSIQEAMRLYPPAWIIDRRAIQDDRIDSMQIKAGDMIGLYTYGIHRDPDLWDRPRSFNPERFSSKFSVNRHKYAYFPFGGGPRFCIGQQFSMMEMKMVLSAMVKRFDWKLTSSIAIQPQPLITLRPQQRVLIDIVEKH